MHDDQTEHPRISVIVPAYNEATVIGRCLAALAEGAHTGELEVIVVCNGCTDATADAARAALPQATVIELEEPDKAAALNAGDALATAFPRVFLDADVDVRIDDLRSVAKVLEQPGVHCAAPVPDFVLADRPWTVRKFYEAWRRLPYLNDAMVGSGFYALSQDGRARFDRFPDDLIADDEFVLRHFAPGERAAVSDATFAIHTPRSLRGLLAVRTRVYRGNRELARMTTLTAPDVSRRSSLARLARPGMLTALGVYVAVNGVASLRSRKEGATWERDESSRAPAGDPRRVGYVVSRYPSVSHTFVMREVRAARSVGLDVRTFSVKAAVPEELLSDADRAEAASTWSVRPRSPWRLLRPHARFLLRHPGVWIVSLATATRRAAPGVRARLWQVFYFGEAVVLADECRRQGVRHLHAHHANVAADLAWITAEIGERLDGPDTWVWTLTFHGSGELSDVRGTNLPAKLASAALVLCVSDYTRAQLLSWLDPGSWDKVVVVHTGADLERHHPATQRHARPGVVEVLCVGRIDPVKGYPVLVDAAAELRRDGRPFRLTIVGGGKGSGELREQVSSLGLDNVVRLLGPLGQDELPELYRAADVFCLPSFTESLPVVLMEAMASGLAVVATSIAGIPELVTDGEDGLLVPPGRGDLLAEALGRLIDDAELRDALGRRGRARVVTDFDADACGREAARRLAEVPLSVPRSG